MDEVFSELDSSRDSADAADTTLKKEDEDGKRSGLPHDIKELKELVSSTLTLSARRNKKKQQATVKPIKASDEKTLENAIAMANALASKSMHDLDKRHLDEDFYENAAAAAASRTPNSPSKKFTFWQGNFDAKRVLTCVL